MSDKIYFPIAILSLIAISLLSCFISPCYRKFKKCDKCNKRFNKRYVDFRCGCGDYMCYCSDFTC